MVGALKGMASQDVNLVHTDNQELFVEPVMLESERLSVGFATEAMEKAFFRFEESKAFPPTS